MNRRLARLFPLALALTLLLASFADVTAQQPAAPQPATPQAATQQPGAPVPAAPGAPPVAGRGGRGPLPPLGPATEPRPRDDARHQSFLEVARAGNIDLLFVGDSITDWWRQPQRGLPVFTEYFGTLKTANFGIAGDTT